MRAKIKKMYAVINIQGFQYKVVPNQYLYVNRMDKAVGEQITLEEILLIDDNGNVRVGKPYVSGVKVSATVLEHLKDDKKIVFKKKRRKGYKVKKGHRQQLTKIQINSIN